MQHFGGASRAVRRGAPRLLLLTIALGCARPMSHTVPGTTSTTTAAAAPGRWVTGARAEAAGARPWRLWLPRGHDASRPTPLVVLLHGCTQDAADVARGARVESHADAAGVMVLLPEQPTWGNARTCWNWYDPAHQRRDAGEPGAIAAITREVMATYGADPARVWMAGISAGGAMALIASAAYPELYAAAGVHSAIPLGAATSVPEALAVMQRGAADPARVSGEAMLALMGPRARAVPTIVFHGAADHVVAARNAEQVVAQVAAVHARFGAPGDAREDTSTVGGRAVRRLTRAGGAIEWWTVEGLGHAWSGGSPEGTFTDAAGPDAMGEMLRFFGAHPMREQAAGSREQETGP